MSSAITPNPLPCLPREHLSSVHSKPAGLPDVNVNFPFPPLKCLLSSSGSATALYQHHDPTPTIPGGPPLEPPVGWFSPLSQLPAHVFHLPLHPTILVYVIPAFSVVSRLANKRKNPVSLIPVSSLKQFMLCMLQGKKEPGLRLFPKLGRPLPHPLPRNLFSQRRG